MTINDHPLTESQHALLQVTARDLELLWSLNLQSQEISSPIPRRFRATDKE